MRTWILYWLDCTIVRRQVCPEVVAASAGEAVRALEQRGYPVDWHTQVLVYRT